MGTKRWAGGAPRVAQVNTYLMGGTWEVGDLIRVTVGAKAWDYAVTSATITTFLPLFVTAIQALVASDYLEFKDFTATSSSGTLTLTGSTAGKPFVATLTPLESNGGAADTQTIEGAGTATTGTAATACSSPNHWSIAANWVENAVPVNADDVVIDRGPSIKYGLAQSAVTVATLKILPSWLATSELGLPSNTSPQAPESGYPEYRDQRLAIGATIVDVETQSRRVRLDVSVASSTITVRDTGQPATANEDALDVKMAATAAAHFLKGFIGLNAQIGDTGTVADVNVSYRSSPASDVRLRCGPGLTCTNLDMAGGQVWLKNGAVTITKGDGVLSLEGAVTTLKNRGGVLYLDGTGTITLLENGGVVERRGLAAITLTTLRLFAGSRGNAGEAPVVYTNDVEWYESRLPAGPDDRGADVAYWNFGRHKALTPAAV